MGIMVLVPCFSNDCTCIVHDPENDAIRPAHARAGEQMVHNHKEHPVLRCTAGQLLWTLMGAPNESIVAPADTSHNDAREAVSIVLRMRICNVSDPNWPVVSQSDHRICISKHTHTDLTSTF